MSMGPGQMISHFITPILPLSFSSPPLPCPPVPKGGFSGGGFSFQFVNIRAERRQQQLGFYWRPAPYFNCHHKCNAENKPDKAGRENGSGVFRPHSASPTPS
ncbi:hypothetical protein Bpfe_020224, partial [Biomphalaria pfeifferi]